MTDALHLIDTPEYHDLNTDLAAAVLAIPDEDYARLSHYFHGRYENRYLHPAALPQLQTIIERARAEAARILQQPVTELRAGYWLNIMRKGDITTLHSHDDDDELLSAVYYLQVPDGSGEFRLHERGEIHTIQPVAGRFMFFDPALPHEVAAHRSDIPRISIGINIGPAGEVQESGI
ncbi:MAG: 2OG-Fe(II) oxygenase family protein [Gammaproteobacteria bacterium]|nr:2OG-Fe(II) oxygenase family protein [Gammaproteobacteria bacterium]MDH5653365.1 2OG-Fe(II) oxygenase family protein [Gammaproteobacteria bacterium]